MNPDYKKAFAWLVKHPADAEDVIRHLVELGHDESTARLYVEEYLRLLERAERRRQDYL